QKLMERQGEYGEYNSSVKFLSSCLKAFHKREVIILIDEYDVPLETAYYSGFYDEMVSFIRSLFESALKGNDSLNFAVVTGCLKINRESIFTGLNHLDAVSVTTPRYNEAFGFTEEEVKEILSYYDRSEKFGQVKDWYDGYLFGGKEIYNPWSILKFMQDSTASPAHEPQAYWVNTSSNQIVRDLVDHATSAVRREIEILMSGGTIEKVIDENITYGNLHQSEDNLWSMLYFTGYLKDCGRSQQNPDAVKLCIPNREVAGVYKTVITSWFDEKIRNENLDTLQRALEEGDCPAITEIISNLLLETISYYDYSENYYHGFLTGLLTKMGKYTLTSNREAGTGRADLLMREERLYGRAMILELKVADDVRKMEGKCEEALRQIESQDYDTELAKDGCQPILKYGICFYKKGCLVKKAESK
ncbi:MAG: AAA family ATPase, partial [Firmicutes bacterium]|nr:AAA family ATPase [Bacillota bacterium]